VQVTFFVSHKHANWLTSLPQSAGTIYVGHRHANRLATSEVFPQRFKVQVTFSVSQHFLSVTDILLWTRYQWRRLNVHVTFSVSNKLKVLVTFSVCHRLKVQVTFSVCHRIKVQVTFSVCHRQTNGLTTSEESPQSAGNIFCLSQTC
jgi:hypothetical protein